MRLANYLEQHGSIRIEINALRELMAKNHFETDAGQLALHISALAGKIKIHLLAEDKYLYPELMVTDEPRVKKMAVDYQHDMGDLAENFMNFKSLYNTPIKILKNISDFQTEITNIVNQIQTRMDKEEKELYQLLN